MTDGKEFKNCSLCKRNWDKVEEFLRDHEVEFRGYQAYPNDPGRGLFLFNHRVEGCCTTLSIPVSEVHDHFHPEESFVDSLKAFSIHGKKCPGFCEVESNVEPCPNVGCGGKKVRDLMQKIRKVKKHGRR